MYNFSLIRIINYFIEINNMYLRIKLINLIKRTTNKCNGSDNFFINFKKKNFSLTKILYFILFNYYMNLYCNNSIYNFNTIYKKEICIFFRFYLLF